MDLVTETVSFWLDNKMSSGIKVAAAGDLDLVLYRERYYVVVDGAAQTKAGKTVRYAKSSLPVLWRKALRGETVLPPAAVAGEELQAMSRQTRQIKKQDIKASDIISENITSLPTTTKTTKITRNRKNELKPLAQDFVIASCPYCEQKHELATAKGKNGKPFFLTCSRCNDQFAVRLVQVLQFQAQTAGFSV